MRPKLCFVKHVSLFSFLSPSDTFSASALPVLRLAWPSVLWHLCHQVPLGALCYGRFVLVLTSKSTLSVTSFQLTLGLQRHSLKEQEEEQRNGRR